VSSAKADSDWIDGSLYPDEPALETLTALGDRIDFVARLCGAWDFGIMPVPETLHAVLKPDWREAVEQTQMLTSCAYHLLRELHGLAPVRYLGPEFPHLRDDPCLQMM